MASNDPQMKIRLPEGLKGFLASTSTASNRSMNAEIVERLTRSITLDDARRYAKQSGVAEGQFDEWLKQFEGAIGKEIPRKPVTSEMKLSWDIEASVPPAGESDLMVVSSDSLNQAFKKAIQELFSRKENVSWLAELARRDQDTKKKPD